MIRVFVGTSPNGEDAEAAAVLEYTLRRHASEPVDITWMALSRDPASLWGGWRTERFSTPFTPFRWTVPEACGFQGRAIYLDVDMFVVADIAELWRQPMPDGAAALINDRSGKLRTCVTVFDCAAARRILPGVRELKRQRDPHDYAMAALVRSGAFGAFEGRWNCVDLKGSALDDPDLKLVHMSSIAHQPATRHAAARLALSGRRHWYDGESFDHWRPELLETFDRLLAEAAEAGYTPDRYEPAELVPYRIRSYAGVRVKGFSA